MSAVLIIWFEFGLCAILIGFAGTRLCRYADVIADKTGLSGSWIGLILLATVTSLPELVTGVSALTLANIPNIAVGSLLGSCVFNLAILVVLDYLARGESLYRRASSSHILSAGFGVILIGFVGLNVLLIDKTTLTIAHLGIYTPAIVLFYIVAMRALYIHERAQVKEFVEQVADRYPDMTLHQAYVRYVLSASLVIAAGIYLPFVGAQLAEVMGWHNTFVGTLFIAGITSLPELAVSIAALRMGALDMAIANLLGSNLFNILILALEDIIFVAGPLLTFTSPLHAFSAFSAVIMSGIVIVGLVYRPSTRLFISIGWISLSLFTLYLLNTYVFYLHGG
ncbi:sodium:calcium antiporter [Nitrosomonas ureae]|uniref:Cation:H+ antiporter n=1 Tax=Nitrosomonas ureae TaxID=44577 RepID=A0A1H2HCI6_9PROT|nr:sodium:calcium antiporter [Nitrosomonas ureae]ALQ49983.1 cation transporter [Nitrosomonas ureae]SDU29543.1 cation:H+ antiporter [Nitrosomonas ureae]